MTTIVDQLPSDLALTPRSVAGYLAVSGWNLEATTEAVELWSLRENGSLHAQVRLPLDESYVDFSKRFDAVLRRICLVHDWDSFQLATNVLSTRSDLLYIRADQLIRQDSIPLRQAEQLISGTSKMLTAAAWSTLEKRATHSGRRPGLVRNFIDEDVRMGHTQRGSFVITVITRLDESENTSFEQRDTPEEIATEERLGIQETGPVSREDTAPSADLEFEPETLLVSTEPSPTELALPPFQRRVMSTLATALRETSRLTEDDHIRSGLSSSVDSGVSSLLCDSLTDMTQFIGLRALELSFRWAAAEPREHPAIEQVAFSRDEIPKFQDISTRLRERDDIERVTVFGRVTKLERTDTDEENTSLVTIRGVFERNKERVFKVKLEGSEHELAIRAYREQFPLVITGDIDRRQRSFTLQGQVTVESMRK